MKTPSVIHWIIDFYDALCNAIKRVVYYEFIASIITSFLIGGSIPLGLFLFCSDVGFTSIGINRYAIIGTLVWISFAPYLIRSAYKVLKVFLRELEHAKLPILLGEEKIKSHVDGNQVMETFYSNIMIIISQIAVIVILSPVLFGVWKLSGLHFAFMISVVIFWALEWSFGLYFMLNSVDVIVKIIEKIDIKEIGMFHYDNMGGVKFLAGFSNIITLLWFSSSLIVPLAIDLLKMVFANGILQYGIFAFIIVIGFWAFLYPQMLIRKKSIEIKHYFLSQANELAEARYFSDKTKILDLKKEDWENITAYNEQYVKKIQGLAVWPFDISGIFWFLSSVFVPVLVAFITYILNIKA